MLPYFSSSKLRIFQRASRGFTIIELLAAITLVSIIMFVVVTFVDVSRQSINHSQSRLDSASLATRVFERIHLDLANMVRRDDVAN
ncbi:MAG: prepilin-type N-terminal cleavage/methylation domain-containing protein, partial [Verrucomicrobiota bacterium]